MRFSSSTERTLQTLLLRDFPREEAEQLWQRLCRIYESYLTDLPYTGGKSNPMWDDLYDSLAVFAYYEVLPQKPTLEQFEQVVALNFNRVHFPSWLRFGTGSIRFCVRLIGRVMGRNLNRHHADGSWGNCWGIGTPANLDNLPGMQLRGCPIMDFARKHGYAHLMPAMCNSDFEKVWRICIFTWCVRVRSPWAILSVTTILLPWTLPRRSIILSERLPKVFS